MIPRRDISLYNNLAPIIVDWIKDKKKKVYPEKFRAGLQEYLSSENIFLLGGGRQSFHLIFDNVPYESGSEIIVPNYYLKVLIPIFKSKGLVPVFCDIDENNLSNDLEDVLEKISEDTRFIILSHMFGICGDVDDFIAKVKDKKEDILIIEDCAHSFGSEYENKSLGIFGDFALFSFNYIKTLKTLEGGALLVGKKEYLKKIEKDYSGYEEMKKRETLKKVFYYYFLLLVLKTPIIRLLKFFLKNKKIKKTIKKIHNSHKKNWKKEKLSPFLSFIGNTELKSFEERQQKIKNKLETYEVNLSKKLLDERPSGMNSEYSNYFLILKTDKDSKIISKKMFSEGVDIAIEDEIMDLCVEDKNFKKAESVYDSIIQLPLYCGLKNKEVKKIAEKINKISR